MGGGLEQGIGVNSGFLKYVCVCQQIWETQEWRQNWKRSVSFQSPKKTMPKNAQTTTHCTHLGSDQSLSCVRLL